MAKFTREQQIRGLEKALANPRTPAHLKPSMRLRLEKLKTQPGLDTGVQVGEKMFAPTKPYALTSESWIEVPEIFRKLFGGE